VNATQEKWRPVPGYEGMYEVSDLGQVRSLDRVIVNNIHGGMWVRPGRILKPWMHSRGYPWVTLAGQKKFAIHRLVLLAFVGPIPKGMIVRHLNDIKTDNRLVNLRYGTHLENSFDIITNGNHKQANQTHCIRGHEFTPENTALNSGRKGRSCRICMYIRIQKYQAGKDADSRQRNKAARPNTPDEKWIAVPGFEGYYSVSNQGRVRSEERSVIRGGRPMRVAEKYLKPGVRGGYPFVQLCKGRVNKRVDIHILVLRAFVGPRPPGQVIRHLNDDPCDNWLENLAYGTHEQNKQDQIRNNGAD
jgi:hypothetical protein